MNALDLVAEANLYDVKAEEDFEGARDRLVGRIQRRLGNFQDAEVNFRLALESYLSTGNIFEAAYSTVELIEVLLASGSEEEARRLARRTVQYLTPLRANPIAMGAVSALSEAANSKYPIFFSKVRNVIEILKRTAQRSATPLS